MSKDKGPIYGVELIQTVYLRVEQQRGMAGVTQTLVDTNKEIRNANPIRR